MSKILFQYFSLLIINRFTNFDKKSFQFFIIDSITLNTTLTIIFRAIKLVLLHKTISQLSDHSNWNRFIHNKQNEKNSNLQRNRLTRNEGLQIDISYPPLAYSIFLQSIIHSDHIENSSSIFHAKIASTNTSDAKTLHHRAFSPLQVR